MCGWDIKLMSDQNYQNLLTKNITKIIVIEYKNTKNEKEQNVTHNRDILKCYQNYHKHFWKISFNGLITNVNKFINNK